MKIMGEKMLKARQKKFLFFLTASQKGGMTSHFCSQLSPSFVVFSRKCENPDKKSRIINENMAKKCHIRKGLAAKKRTFSWLAKYEYFA